MYTALLTFDPEEWGNDQYSSAPAATPDVEAALELLSGTAWDGAIDTVRPARAQLYQCFGLPEPKLVKRAATAAAAGEGAVYPLQHTDENVSYQALIDRAMRGGS